MSSYCMPCSLDSADEWRPSPLDWVLELQEAEQIDTRGGSVSFHFATILASLPAQIDARGHCLVPSRRPSGANFVSILDAHGDEIGTGPTLIEAIADIDNECTSADFPMDIMIILWKRDAESRVVHIAPITDVAH